ncbi:MAG: methyltransferase [Candidatus Hodarchaeales archaeon]
MPSKFFLSVSEHPEVYSPREDTWFMTEVLIDFLKVEIDKNPFKTICEVGVGTGHILIALGMNFPELRLIGIDISLEAVKLSKKNVETTLNPVWKQRYDLICSDLFSCFNEEFKPEIIYFNPPYVRTSFEELNSKDPSSLSFAGGPSGVIVIERFLEEIRLIDFRVAFFLTSNWNDNSLLLNKYSDVFQFEAIAQKKLPDERLICFKVKRI